MLKVLFVKARAVRLKGRVNFVKYDLTPYPVIVTSISKFLLLKRAIAHGLLFGISIAAESLTLTPPLMPVSPKYATPYKPKS